MACHQSTIIRKGENAELASCLEEILSLIKPTEEDCLKRETIISQLTYIIQSEDYFDDVDVVPHGSYASDLDTKWSDLDISIRQSTNPNTFLNKDISRIVLSEIHSVLLTKGFGDSFQLVPLARVPILMFKINDIACDVSVDNYAGCIKSKMLLWISQIDGRFRDLVLVIKEWAKAHNISDAKAGTLSSYSLTLLVVFHLQTCTPPILPPLRDIYKGNVASYTDFDSIFNVPERYIEEECAAAIAKFHTKNEDSLSELLISFFEKFANIQSRAGDCVISTFSGRWESIESEFRWRRKPAALTIEDPFDQKDNASRAVTYENLPIIAQVFGETYQKLSSPAVLSNKTKLMHCILKLETNASKYGDRVFTEDPCNIPMVISALIGNCYVHRILIASGSEANVVTEEALEGMKIGLGKVRPFDGTLLDSAGWPVNVSGVITLPFTIGNEPTCSTREIKFFVVKAKLAYNAILGQPGLNRLEAVVDEDYLVIKFPTQVGIGQTEGNKQTARRCHANAPNFLPTLKVMARGT